MTQQELGERAGVSRVRINQLENGNVFDMRMGNVIRVLNALGLGMRISERNNGYPVYEELVEIRERESSSPDF